MTKTSVTTTVEVELNAKIAAQWFSGLSDEEQADFFIEVAEISKAWGPHWAGQYWLAGRHLATCKCSNDDARELVRQLAGGLKDGETDAADGMT